jgi:hypothetical protein
MKFRRAKFHGTKFRLTAAKNSGRRGSILKHDEISKHNKILEHDDLSKHNEISKHSGISKRKAPCGEIL